MKVTMSGQTHVVIEGGSFPIEHEAIWDKFRYQARGFGRHYTADLTADEAAEFEAHVRGYAEAWASEPRPEPDMRRETQAMFRDADRVRDALAQLGADQ